MPVPSEDKGTIIMPLSCSRATSIGVITFFLHPSLSIKTNLLLCSTVLNNHEQITDEIKAKVYSLTLQIFHNRFLLEIHFDEVFSFLKTFAWRSNTIKIGSEFNSNVSAKFQLQFSKKYLKQNFAI